MAILLLMLLPIAATAQPVSGGEPALPIDGGISCLIAAGVGYAAKKLKHK